MILADTDILSALAKGDRLSLLLYTGHAALMPTVLVPLSPDQ
jgi:hypothetical protein